MAMLPAGTILGNRYEVIELVGSGGMADVYKAKDHKLNRMVAIKILKQEFGNDVDFVRRFHVEAQAAAGLMHPNVVTIYDVGEEEGLHYIVMELVEGMTLQSYIRKQGRLTPEETVRIAVQIAQGLEAAHGNNTVHRDIKPQNIIVTKEGRVKVTDFGIARASNANTITMATIGSVHYFSPEQARGGYVDARSDIYSLGITMYEMVTGHVPFDGENPVAVALMHLQDEVVPPSQAAPELPRSLEKIILRCVNKKPEFRYLAVADMVTDLQKVFDQADGEYVKIQTGEGADTGSPTIRISGDDVNKIKQMSGQYTPYEKEEGQGGQDSDLTIFKDTEEINPKLEKLILGLTVLVGVMFAIIIIALIVNTVGRSMGREKEQTATEAVTQASSEEQTADTGAQAELVPMPNVVGMSKEEATKALEEKGLHPEAQEEISNDVEKGYVIRQSIPYGYDLERGQTVTIVVSLGREQASVPDVTGKKEEKAKSSLSEKGFQIKTKEEYSSTVKEGRVISQSPKGGGKADYGSQVTLLISKGPEIKEEAVPSVVGKSLANAKSVLEKAGFSANAVSEEYSDRYKKGTVVAQDPYEGTKLAKGETVKLVISLGQEPKSYHYPGQVSVDCPFGEGVESGKVTLVFSQGGKEKTIYNKRANASAFPLTVEFEGFQEGSGTVTVYSDGNEHERINITLSKVEE